MYVISTAGHVDHGKSTLIQQLTGIDPDRLAEEKARGLTIDLGFAWLTLPNGEEVGIVDVPGHERFVHNMLAGVGSVGATLFVVAANEGWKPQSEEHLAILDLLGARAGVVALTKSDLLQQPELTDVVAQTRKRLEGTSLEDAPIIPCSALTGDGLDTLLRALETMLERAPLPDGPTRLCVDRSFSIKGAGTVVTGTLTGGPLRVEQEVMILPAGHRARIRSIQTHKESRTEAHPISRVALNLAGLERTQIRRGDVVVLPDRWEPTHVLDMELRAVRGLDHPVTNRGAFKAYIGSAEVDARIRLHDGAELKAGESCFARINLSEPVVAAPFDHVVLRDSGRRATVAGGQILDAHPLKHPDINHLQSRAKATRSDIPTIVVAERGVLERRHLEKLSGTSAEPAGSVFTKTWVFSKKHHDDLTARLDGILAAFHAREPLASGMPREDARARMRLEDPRLFDELVDANEHVIAGGPILKLARHSVSLTPEQTEARARLLSALTSFTPPLLKSVQEQFGEKFVRAAIDAGDVVKVSNDLAFARAQIEHAKELIRAAVQKEGPLTAARIKETLGTSRKYAIPLLEYLDSSGFTKRHGDTRVLAE